ncbi:carbohydrate porin [Halomonas sp. ML-15]|uniref:carbohydrate porin n=1 Tax=Halomonas sp. ML-15 TaxID=2773305 RepID=UPI001746DCE1|nr:carbohydrate porin [Halomonas sp. ML-15]MBD3897413.1 carbohydrate porin [Halomonas sp. ML-15]
MTHNFHPRLLLVAGLAAVGTTPSLAQLVYEGESGELTFGGDVELDINAQNTHAGEGPIFFEDDVDHGDEFNQTGRILLDIGGERRSPAHHYARFKVQPLIQTDGDFAVDDAWLAIGNRHGLEFKVGRFEAYDLFPLGQDVFVGFSGDTSDGLYRDGQGYVYQAKEGRGRGGDSGQVMVSQRSGNLYAEISTLFGDRTDLFDTDTYHGYRIDPDEHSKDSFIVRPVIAWTPGPWTLAAGLETNLVDDAIVDERGADIGDRTGYGMRVSYRAGDWQWNVNLAHLDAFEETNQTLGVNALWRQFGVGYIHARNDIDDVNPVEGDDVVFSVPGRYDIDTLYTSYHFADVLSIDDLSLYLGAYYSRIDHQQIDNLDDADRYGARVRFKYLF